MTAAARGLVLGPLLLALLAGPAPGQSSPCTTGAGKIKASALGGDVMREGAGFGPVSLGGSPSDVERAWGPPGQCRPQGTGVVYQYFIESDTDDSALLLVVDMESGRVDGLLATLLPHSRGRGPSVRTGRGVVLVGSLDDVVRTYGAPVDPNARTWIYASDGVLFLPTKGVVAGIGVFRSGAPPSTFLRLY